MNERPRSCFRCPWTFSSIFAPTADRTLGALVRSLERLVVPSSSRKPRKTDNTLVKALARAFRWKRMLESGEFTNIADLAEREGIGSSYMTRVLRLTLLAPDMTEDVAVEEHDTALPANVFAVQSAAFSLAENGFDASAVVPSPKSARFCTAAGVVPTQPAPS